MYLYIYIYFKKHEVVICDAIAQFALGLGTYIKIPKRIYYTFNRKLCF